MTEEDRKRLLIQQSVLMFECKNWEDLQAKHSTDSDFVKYAEKRMCDLENKAEHIRMQLEMDGETNGI